jgi:tricorn protease
MHQIVIKSACLTLLLWLCISLVAQPSHAVAANSDTQPLGYYRDPTLHGDTVVFTAQGDLWKSSTTNRQPAQRLTTHANLERSAKFSPNGSKIAFVASYQNIPAVYVIDANGGKAQQVSFELASSKLHAWVDDTTLLISTPSDTGMHSSWVLKTINIEDLTTKTLPLSDAVEGAISKDGDTLVFIQHGLQVSSDNANHYKGGGAGEMWRFSLESRKEATLLTKGHAGSVRTPMLYEQGNTSRIYFISNEASLDNLWSMSLNGSDIKQHTQFTDWAVRNASIYGNAIVFQHGADIKIYNIAAGSVTSVDISLLSDFANMRTRYILEPLEYFESAAISPDGNKAVVLARGKIALASTNSQRLIKVQSDPSSRNRSPIMSKNGQSIYAISDISGDYEIVEFDAQGASTTKQLTKNGKELKTGLWLSPDGKWLAYTQNSGQLYLLNIATGKTTRANPNIDGVFRDITFSHDSRYLAASLERRKESRPSVYVQEIPSGESAILTSAKYASYQPAFSADMQWLYFLSDRSFTPAPSSPWGDRNMGTEFDKRTQLFAIALAKEATFPFAEPTELSAPDKADKKAKDDDDSSNEEIEKVSIDFVNIQKRLWQVDIPQGNYTGLLANDSALFLTQDKTLSSLAFEHGAKLTQMTDGVSEVKLSSDGEHLLLTKQQNKKTQLFIVPALATYPTDIATNTVKLDTWTLDVQPQQEWQQLFKDAWLMHRDSLFDKNMRGLDWPATKQKYMPLLNRITERSELNDIFEQMMGELNTLHSQVRGGDLNDDPNAPTYATLGASYTDTSTGVRIDAIYQYDIEIISQAPPLAKPGVNVQVGDIIIAVNNLTIKTTAELHKALINRAGQQTLLTLKRKDESLKTVVEPANVALESRLRYQNWVASNLAAVSAQNPNVGYLHLYAMGESDVASFAREFYAQYEKHGLIIDVRRNRGGNIDSMIIEKLLRRAWSFWESDTFTETNMQQTFRGHLVVLADQFTYSDGETFTAGIKSLELGTVIGKQTAGAGVWLSSSNRLVDGGIARVAQFPVFSLEGDWLTEGRGISPNIEVDNLPHATFKGKDAQLEAAMALLAKKMREEPVLELKPKAFPKVEDAAKDAQAIGKKR